MQWQKMKLPFLIVKEAYLDHGQHGTLKKTKRKVILWARS